MARSFLPLRLSDDFLTMPSIYFSHDSALVFTFGLYLLIMLVVGGVGYRATNNLDDYILGGRRLGALVTALSAGSSDMSAWLLMGLPGAVFLSGLTEAWIAVGLTVGAYLNWRFVAARLRLYTEMANNALTLPDFFAQRFADERHVLRVVSALVILVFFTIYCASGIVAGARLFSNMFAISYTEALYISALCTIAYVLIGGFLAVSWTDTIQASLMIFALVATVLTAVSLTYTGLPEGKNLTDFYSAAQLDFFTGTSIIGVISAAAWGLGYFGQPHILVRFMAADSVRAMPAARRIGMTWMIISLAAAVGVGMVGVAYFGVYPDQGGEVRHNAEMVFIELANHIFNPWWVGVMMAAILAAVMSTLSCQLLVCSSALTDDFYRNFLHKTASQRHLVWVGRIMVGLVSAIAIVLSLDQNSRVLTMVSYAWAGFGASFGSVILLSLFWERMTLSGAFASMVVGAVTVVVWKQFAWFGLYEIVPGFVFAMLAGVVVSLLSKANPEVVQRHRAFVEKLRQEGLA